MGHCFTTDSTSKFSKSPFLGSIWILIERKLARETKRKRVYMSTRKSPALVLLWWSWAVLHLSVVCPQSYQPTHIRPGVNCCWGALTREKESVTKPLLGSCHTAAQGCVGCCAHNSCSALQQLSHCAVCLPETCGTSEEMLTQGEALLKRVGTRLAEPGFGAPHGHNQGMLSAATAAVLVALVLC